jgi:formate dehydrogenase major subunit
MTDRRWPLLRQIAARDLGGLDGTAFSTRTQGLRPRTVKADSVARSVCPYCGVGCGQLVYVEKGRITDIEGDPDSPISEGALCPKGSATFQLVTGAHRHDHVLYRRPHGTEWEQISLEDAMEMVAQRVKASREATWEETLPDGRGVHRTNGIVHLGGATLDNEENYLIKKLLSGGLGVIQVENQARI